MQGFGCYLAMVVIQLAYGGAIVLVKLALEKRMNQLVFIVYRHIIAMLVLGPFAYILERGKRPIMSFSLMVKIFLLASLGTTIHLNVYYAGLKYTSPTVACALSNVIPGLTLVLAVFFGLENVKIGSTKGKTKVIGTIVSTGGSLIFIFWKGRSFFKASTLQPLNQTSNIYQSGNTKREWMKGSIIILLSYVAWSAWLISQAMVSKIYPAPLSLTVLICFFASLQSAIVALFWGKSAAIWNLGWDIQLLALLYCGAVISAGVNCLQMWCISKKGPLFAAIFSPLQLVFVALYSTIFFTERLHLGSLIGALVMIMGLYCVLWGKTSDSSNKEEEHSNNRSNVLDPENNKIADVEVNKINVLLPMDI